MRFYDTFNICTALKMKKSSFMPARFTELPDSSSRTCRALRFGWAILHNAKDVVEEMLLQDQSSEQADEIDVDKNLQEAVHQNFCDIVEVLLKYKANPNQEHILNYAVSHGYFDVVATLLKYDANPNWVDTGTKFPTSVHALFLNEESSNDDLDKMFVLLKSYNVDINVKTTEGRSIMLDACSKRDLNLIETLLKYGADINDRTTIARTHTLIHAENHPSPPNPKYPPIHVSDLKDVTPLHEVVQFQDTEVKTADLVNLLLSKGADVNARDNKGYTPLMRCVQTQNDPEVVDMLLKAGSDPSARALDGQTPLTQTLMFNRNLTPKLLDAGADVNIIYTGIAAYSYTPLSFVTSSAFIENIVREVLLRTDRKLLNHKGTNFCEDTSIMIAVRGSLSTDLIREMIQRGCDPNLGNLYHFTAVSAAIQRHISLLRTVLLYGGKANCLKQYVGDCSRDPVHLAATLNRINSLKMLLHIGGEICQFTKNHFKGSTAETAIVIRDWLERPCSLQEAVRTILWRKLRCVGEEAAKLYLPDSLKRYIMLGDFVP